MTENESVLVCMRVDGFCVVYPGSVKDRCNVCHAEVWVAPSGQAGIATGQVTKTMCIPCVVIRVREDPPQSVGLLPKTAQEVRQWLGRN